MRLQDCNIIKEHGEWNPNPVAGQITRAHLVAPGKLSQGRVKFVETDNGRFWGVWNCGPPVAHPTTGPFSTLEGAKQHAIAACVP